MMNQKNHASQLERDLSDDSCTSKPKSIELLRVITSYQRWDANLPQPHREPTNVNSPPIRPSRTYSSETITELTLNLERLATSSPSNIYSMFMESHSPNVPPKCVKSDTYQNSAIHTNEGNSEFIINEKDVSHDKADDTNSMIRKEVVDSKSILSTDSVNRDRNITRRQSFILRNSFTASDVSVAAAAVTRNISLKDVVVDKYFTQPLRRKKSLRRPTSIIPTDSKKLLHDQDHLLKTNKEQYEYKDKEELIIGMEILMGNQDAIQTFELRKDINSISSLSSK